MKKILIVPKETDNDHRLIELLHTLFPECEICMVYPKPQKPDAWAKSPLSRSGTIDEKGGSHGKHIDRR
jgi:hypothetical protein